MYTAENLGKVKGCTVKYTGRAPDLTALQQVRPRPAIDTQILEIDLMFIRKAAFLVGVVSPLDYTMVQWMKICKSDNIAPVLKAMIDTMKRFGVTIGIVRSDPGSNLVKAATDLTLADTLLDTTSGGEHGNIVERKIRSIKERHRTGTHSMLYLLCLFLIIALVLFSVSTLNKESGSFSFLHRRPLDNKLDYRLPFGAYVQATAPNTDNTNTARTHGCIHLGPTNNLTGGALMWSQRTCEFHPRSSRDGRFRRRRGGGRGNRCV